MLKKVTNSLFENKKILLCGKGATSALAPKTKTEDSYVVCLNTSALMFDKVDFLFINDYETIEKLIKADFDFSKLSNLIIPLQLHEKSSISARTYLDVFELLKESNTDIYTYKLHTQTMNFSHDERVDHSPLSSGHSQIWSTYHSALLWLTALGLREYDIYGVSKDGVYDSFFEKNNDVGEARNLNWYEINYNVGIYILERNNCSYNIF